MMAKNIYLLLDMDGVFYNAEERIPGGDEAIRFLDTQAIPYLFLTNTSSRPRSKLVQKLQRFDIVVPEEKILTPPVAARRWLQENKVGPVALFVPEATRQEFCSLETVSARQPAAAVVIGDMGEAWDFSLLNDAFRLLMQNENSMLIALGMTRFWKAEDGLRLDAGPYVKALEFATGRQAKVFGKPSPEFYHAAISMLHASPENTWMLGDDIINDVGAAQKLGLKAVLTRSGKFVPADLQRGVKPDAVIDSIAGLPELLQGIRG